ncbi:Sigma-54 interaction domain-containing protein [Dethiosulfatibacter aminovorans DSM 17477]|uniref:Sigma-54 interaction domain-containing protein n=1 Tax=Dethiosulfatibacter aminovorans DSM 17477 TaxID=1121476 RepID=A0A1M6BPV5_9FIRM|nr:sigma 54-interacting transcriptional regulator [Dethiosulfatibacter aminovorans]SHI50746.1 Sigma-54 interaction domain-containing protein [Dethiosulfatibacter aminovorans DSM 17477]
MLKTQNLINSLAICFDAKITVFDSDTIIMKSTTPASTKGKTPQTPRKEKRTNMLSHSHPLIYSEEGLSYVFIPVIGRTKKKNGFLWIFDNPMNEFTDDRLKVLTSLSDSINDSLHISHLTDSNKLYSGVIESIKEHFNMQIQIDKEEEIEKTSSRNTKDRNAIISNYYSGNRFIGSLKASIPDVGNRIHSDDSHSSAKVENLHAKIIGKALYLNRILAKINQISNTDSTVLLKGESGTGKEMIARLIHSESNRKDHSFIAINCAAIPENLLESELFGYEKGAFTGASNQGKIGKIESANRGTLFLDEIGDMPLNLQVKLLRVLQERSIEKIGGNHLIPVDIRIICATNKNLEDMITRGDFREDLFYRINVIPVTLPPLTNKHNDIELLLNYYLKKFCIVQKKHYMTFSLEAMDLLTAYEWPGNVRELTNTVEYCVTMSTSERIEAEHLPSHIRKSEKSCGKGLKKGTKKLSKDEFVALLRKYGDSTDEKKRLAKHLDISLATLYRWIEKYNKG